MSGIRRNLMGPNPAGVPSPLTVHVHPYPTRFHGTFATRPVFGFPWKRQPHAVFKPDDFYSFYPGLNGLGSAALGAYSGPMVYAGIRNERVVALQQQLNSLLVPTHLPITVDGVIGRGTCGALEWAGSRIGGADAIEARSVCTKARVTYTKPTPDPDYTPPAQVVTSSVATSTQTAAQPAQQTVVPQQQAATTAATSTPDVRAQQTAQQVTAPASPVPATEPIWKNKIVMTVGALAVLGTIGLVARAKRKK